MYMQVLKDQLIVIFSLRDGYDLKLQIQCVIVVVISVLHPELEL